MCVRRVTDSRSEKKTKITVEPRKIAKVVRTRPPETGLFDLLDSLNRYISLSRDRLTLPPPLQASTGPTRPVRAPRAARGSVARGPTPAAPAGNPATPSETADDEQTSECDDADCPDQAGDLDGFIDSENEEDEVILARRSFR